MRSATAITEGINVGIVVVSLVCDQSETFREPPYSDSTWICLDGVCSCAGERELWLLSELSSAT